MNYRSEFCGSDGKLQWRIFDGNGSAVGYAASPQQADSLIALLSAAAPQVVADERATYDISTPMHIRIINLDGMLLNYRCAATPEKAAEFKNVILKAVSDIAAPVQAQEPVNITAFLDEQKEFAKSRDGDWWRGYGAALHWVGKELSDKQEKAE